MTIAAAASIIRTLGFLYVHTMSGSNQVVGLDFFGIGPLIWIELLHGVAFSLNDVADKNIQATMFNSSAYLASLRGFIIGIADSVSLIGAGFLYDNYGPGVLFKVLVGFSLFCLAIFCANITMELKQSSATQEDIQSRLIPNPPVDLVRALSATEKRIVQKQE